MVLFDEIIQHETTQKRNEGEKRVRLFSLARIFLHFPFLMLYMNLTKRGKEEKKISTNVIYQNEERIDVMSFFI